MTPDVIGLYPKKSDNEELSFTVQVMDDGNLWLLDPDSIRDYDPEYTYSDIKVALLIEDWISECKEDIITKNRGVGPGDIRAKVDMMDWIIYAMSEIAYIFNPSAIKKIRPLMTRIRYGVKEELMELVSFRGVGRNRARILFDKGIRSKSDIVQISEADLAAIPGIGSALASRMKDQVGGRTVEIENVSPSEEEALLMEMAAEYGEEPVQEEPKKEKTKKKKVEEDGHKQTNLFDF